jgi:hypothetical protein
VPVINKPSQIVERKYQLEDLVADAAEQYAGWIGSTADHVVNSAVKMMLWRDKGFLAWRKTQDPSRRGQPGTPKPGAKA